MSTQTAPLFIAQQVTCAYPVNDFYAPTPRYLYYCLLALVFLTHRLGWLANVFLGTAATYAAAAAIEAFILASHLPVTQDAALVSLPVTGNYSSSSQFSSIESLVQGIGSVTVQPDFLELDFDAVMAVVVTAYLIGLPLQCWSRSARSSRALHLLILLWNLAMLAAVLCMLNMWPILNEAPVQYRFCYPSALDPTSQSNNGGQTEPWQGSWNATIWNVFEHDDTVWSNLPDNCLYPCFNTTQTLLRPSSSLQAIVVSSPSGRHLHTGDAWYADLFQPLIYTAIFTTAAAQIYLLIAARLKLAGRVPIYEPDLVWSKRKEIWDTIVSDWKRGRTILRHGLQSKAKTLLPLSRDQPFSANAEVASHATFYVLRCFTRALTLLVLVASMVLAPFTVVAFICWIEWYIKHDGPPGEDAYAIGQWSAPVSIGLVLFAAAVMRFKHNMASKSELVAELEKKRIEVAELERAVDARELKTLSRRTLHEV